MKLSRIRVLCVLVAAVLILPPARALAQGFGRFGKKNITLHRKLPAVIHFTGSTFNIKASAHDPKFADVTGSLKDMLETELLKDNERFKVDANSPELSIVCDVLDFEIPPPESFTRNEVVLQKGKQLDEPVKYNKIKGSLLIAYQARDTKSGKALDADNVEAKYSEDFEAGTNEQAGKSLPAKMADPFKRAAGKKTEESSGPPSTAELREKLIRDATREIASRITATDQPVEVMLAQGKLDKANKLATSGLWTRDLEDLEQMTPFSDRKEDAYRLYNIGVAYEALAYQSEDRQAAKKSLEEAAINYGKAVDANPEEKYFLGPQKRIETAMAYYRKIEGQEKAIEALNAPPKESAPAAPAPTNPTTNSTAKAAKPAPRSTTKPSTHTGAKPTSSPAAAPPLTNDAIVKMFKAGVDEESIVATIHDAPAVRFDLSPDGQVALANNGLSGARGQKILAAMRARARVPNRSSLSNQ